MWEQDPALFLDNPGLLPLAPLAKTNSPLALLAQVAERIATISDRDLRQNTIAYTEILAGLKFEKDQVYQFLREDAMQESVIYQDILQKGEQREAFKMLSRLINRRFREVDSSILDRIRVLPIEQIEILAEEFLDFSNVADLVTWLDQNESI